MPLAGSISKRHRILSSSILLTHCQDQPSLENRCEEEQVIPASSKRCGTLDHKWLEEAYRNPTLENHLVGARENYHKGLGLYGLWVSNQALGPFLGALD